MGALPELHSSKRGQVDEKAGCRKAATASSEFQPPKMKQSPLDIWPQASARASGLAGRVRGSLEGHGHLIGLFGPGRIETSFIGQFLPMPSARRPIILAHERHNIQSPSAFAYIVDITTTVMPSRGQRQVRPHPLHVRSPRVPTTQHTLVTGHSLSLQRVKAEACDSRIADSHVVQE